MLTAPRAPLVGMKGRASVSRFADPPAAESFDPPSELRAVLDAAAGAAGRELPSDALPVRAAAPAGAASS